MFSCEPFRIQKKKRKLWQTIQFLLQSSHTHLHVCTKVKKLTVRVKTRCERTWGVLEAGRRELDGAWQSCRCRLLLLYCRRQPNKSWKKVFTTTTFWCQMGQMGRYQRQSPKAKSIWRDEERLVSDRSRCDGRKGDWWFNSGPPTFPSSLSAAATHFQDEKVFSFLKYD